MWNARRQVIKGEHRAEGARTALAQALKERLKGGGAAAAAPAAGAAMALMIEANTCTTQWQLGVGNGKLERICNKLDQISPKLESNKSEIKPKLD